jgi:hypothetical protein
MRGSTERSFSTGDRHGDRIASQPGGSGARPVSNPGGRAPRSAYPRPAPRASDTDQVCRAAWWPRTPPCPRRMPPHRCGRRDHRDIGRLGGRHGHRLRAGARGAVPGPARAADSRARRPDRLGLHRQAAVGRAYQPGPEAGPGADRPVGAGRADLPEADRRKVFEARLPTSTWPSRALKVTAVDARTGEFAVFDSAGDASLVSVLRRGRAPRATGQDP